MRRSAWASASSMRSVMPRSRSAATSYWASAERAMISVRFSSRAAVSWAASPIRSDISFSARRTNCSIARVELMREPLRRLLPRLADLASKRRSASSASRPRARSSARSRSATGAARRPQLLPEPRQRVGDLALDVLAELLLLALELVGQLLGRAPPLGGVSLELVSALVEHLPADVLEVLAEAW